VTWGRIEDQQTVSGSEDENLFSEQLHAVGSSLGGEGLYGWHSEQEGDPPGGRVPFKFLLDPSSFLIPQSGSSHENLSNVASG
jgi:predicted alpha/beta-fold hydrolase